MYRKKISYILSILVIVFFGFQYVYAIDLTSSSFIIRDPQMGTGGSFGTSASFKLIGAGNTLFSGRGTSASFIGHNGFLYYPAVTDVVLSAVQNGNNADLSWPAAVATTGLGWVVSGYNTGRASVSGGPYTYTAVGLVTNYTYLNLTPGYYCFILQTLDGLGYVIANSNEVCLTMTPTLTFTISANALNFGTLSAAGPRFADTTTGQASDTVAHTMAASSNAPNGYTISYIGPTLTSNGNTITVASSVNANGTPGTKQFGLSLFTNGTASIPAAYDQAGPTRTFVANTTSTVASTAGPTASETFNAHYLANISAITSAGTYTTDLTYVITGNF